MTEIKIEEKEILEEIFLTFSELYKSPTEELFHEIKTLQLEKRLEWLFQKVGYSNVNIELSHYIKDLKEWEGLYTKCFIGPNQITPPIESLYKVWTTDPSNAMPIANSKGYLYGDSALHMKHLFDHYNMEIPVEFQSMPDHLTLLLEFLSCLIQIESVEHVTQFINDHLDWLDSFKGALGTLDNSQFYRYVTEVLIQFIYTHDLSEMEKTEELEIQDVINV